MSEDIFQLGVKALIKNPRGEILLLKASPRGWTLKPTTYWDLPGGRVKKENGISETLLRELTEETGITKAKVGSLFYASIANARLSKDVGLILLIYCVTANSYNIAISEEHTEYGFFKPKEAATLLNDKYPHEMTDQIANL